MTKYQRYDFQLLYQIYKGKARGENTFVAVRPTGRYEKETAFVTVSCVDYIFCFMIAASFSAISASTS